MRDGRVESGRSQFFNAVRNRFLGHLCGFIDRIETCAALRGEKSAEFDLQQSHNKKASDSGDCRLESAGDHERQIETAKTEEHAEEIEVQGDQFQDVSWRHPCQEDPVARNAILAEGSVPESCCRWRKGSSSCERYEGLPIDFIFMVKRSPVAEAR